MEYLTWLVTLSLCLWVIDRAWFYLFVWTKPVPAYEIFMMLSNNKDEIKQELQEILANGNTSEAYEKFEKLLERHRPNLKIRKNQSPPNHSKNED